jgi:hypothetical protein
VQTAGRLQVRAASEFAPSFSPFVHDAFAGSTSETPDGFAAFVHYEACPTRSYARSDGRRPHVERVHDA